MTDQNEQETENVAKRRALEVAMAALNKNFGKKSVYFFDDDIEPVPAIPTGAFSLDAALGVGGVPRGRIVEIFGPESSGKSTIAMTIVANAQKRGGLAAYVDMEHAIDPGYATALGVNFDELAFSQPDYGEMAIDIVEQLARTGSLDVIVLDSVAALTPKAELEGDMEQQHMGLQPRLMSKAMRKLTPIANETGTAIIFINQIREKIGIMFGSPETTPGGRALRFAATVRIDLRKKEELKNKQGEVTGIKVRAKIIKNKVGPPLREAMFDIVYGYGVDFESSIVEAACDYGVMQVNGAWIKYNNEPFAQGKANAANKLRDDRELAKVIEKEIWNVINPPPIVLETVAVEGEVTDAQD